MIGGAALYAIERRTNADRDYSNRLARVVTATIDGSHLSFVTAVHTTCRRQASSDESYACTASVIAPIIGVYSEHWTGSVTDGDLSAHAVGKALLVAGPTLPAADATCQDLTASGALEAKFEQAVARASDNEFMTISQLEALARTDKTTLCSASQNSFYRPWADVRSALTGQG